MLAKTLGYPKDKETSKVKAEKKVLAKAMREAKQTQFDISPAGDYHHTAIAANKKRKKLKEKAIESQVLRVGKDQQISYVKDKIAIAEEKLLAEKNFGVLDSHKKVELIISPGPKKLEIKEPDIEDNYVYGYEKTLKMMNSIIGGSSDFVNTKILFPTLKRRGHDMKIVKKVVKDQLAKGNYSQPKPNVICRRSE